MTLAEMKEKYRQEADALATPGASDDPSYDQRKDALYHLFMAIYDKRCESRHLTWFGVKI